MLVVGLPWTCMMLLRTYSKKRPLYNIKSTQQFSDSNSAAPLPGTPVPVWKDFMEEFGMVQNLQRD